MTTTPPRTAAGPGRAAARYALVAVLTAACWLAWLGWDTQYRTDPVTGDVTGPYEAWQVVGCVVSLLAVTVLAVRALGGLRAVATVAVTFTAAWVATQAPRDESGLWLVGALLVLLGTAAGAGVVALVAGARRAAVAGRMTNGR
ncbi:hypothetical protein [Cellulomonas wangsupingiae]|uniref:Trp biosynthesis protein n=1 Tax=Cellulomonas wangsupingiae TaxID=2968085 RepID=A0ABY5K401_9CELL|nr:hypothetical protein [Cellulomonas wangsupingiae]MCC2336423.1 hypothetical protein [Cellulomonas wangsupingiae]MCM0640887.1 hypothetical protein [Cellulomonas wangsupingiae]UUI64695.1 hypothetical protein NP075_16500 [Cellulomonas wangsupingiae]